MILEEILFGVGAATVAGAVLASLTLFSDHDSALGKKNLPAMLTEMIEIQSTKKAREKTAVNLFNLYENLVERFPETLSRGNYRKLFHLNMDINRLRSELEPLPMSNDLKEEFDRVHTSYKEMLSEYGV